MPNTEANEKLHELELELVDVDKEVTHLEAVTRGKEKDTRFGSSRKLGGKAERISLAGNRLDNPGAAHVHQPALEQCRVGGMLDGAHATSLGAVDCRGRAVCSWRQMWRRNSAKRGSVRT